MCVLQEPSMSLWWSNQTASLNPLHFTSDLESMASSVIATRYTGSPMFISFDVLLDYWCTKTCSKNGHDLQRLCAAERLRNLDGICYACSNLIDFLVLLGDIKNPECGRSTTPMPKYATSFSSFPCFVCVFLQRRRGEHITQPGTFIRARTRCPINTDSLVVSRRPTWGCF